MSRWQSALISAALFAGCSSLALVAVSASAAAAEELPLTSKPGNKLDGERIFSDREKGHCLLCHRLVGNPEPFQGTIAPPLDGIGSRLDPAEIRFRIVDISRLLPDTIMPAYYRTEGLSQVATAYQGKPVLTAQEIEHLVAYLAAQKDS